MDILITKVIILKPTLIYCAGGNRQWARLFINAGYEYGARLPEKVYYPPIFVDQEYENPDRLAYMAQLARYCPRLATVLDLQCESQFDEVISWALQAFDYVSEAVIIIPKYPGAIEQIRRVFPEQVGVCVRDGRFKEVQIRLGYSVPTSYGSTYVDLAEFGNWPTHLLGGSPVRQVELARLLNVQSADQNYFHHKIKFGQFFDGKRWIQLRSVGCDAQGLDKAREVIARSVPHIMAMWDSITV
jgi:hypothetical protein